MSDCVCIHIYCLCRKEENIEFETYELAEPPLTLDEQVKLFLDGWNSIKGYSYWGRDT